jgi:preprotein translocase subunit YajC
MPFAAILVIMLQSLIFIGSIVLIIYLIVQRIEKKKQETFEDRDN